MEVSAIFIAFLHAVDEMEMRFGERRFPVVNKW